MLGRRHEIARLQSDFYRDQYRKILRWLMMALFIMFLLVLGIIYSIFMQPAIKYYANTVEGHVLAMPRPVALTTN